MEKHTRLTLVKKAEVVALISDRANCMKGKFIRDKQGHYIKMKYLILQDDIAILIIEILNKRTLNMGQNLIVGISIFPAVLS